MGSFVSRVSLATTAVLLWNAAGAEGLPTAKYLPLTLANKAAAAAISVCAAQGYLVSATVVDREGVIRVTLVGDGAGSVSVGSSYRKAFTAAAFGQPTLALQQRARDPNARPLPPLDPLIIPLAGGIPIKVGETTLAGLGVGGADSSEKDEACALAGVAAIQDQLK